MELLREAQVAAWVDDDDDDEAETTEWPTDANFVPRTTGELPLGVTESDYGYVESRVVEAILFLDSQPEEPDDRV